MNDWLMNFVDVFLMDHWLMYLMNNWLMMLMNDLLMFLNYNILVMFMNYILMLLFYDRSLHVCLDDWSVHVLSYFNTKVFSLDLSWFNMFHNESLLEGLVHNWSHRLSTSAFVKDKIATLAT